MPSSSADLERDVTIVVKTFERPNCLRRLVGSIRRFYPTIPVLVVDDSREPLEPVPEGITRYLHEPFDSLAVAGGRNFGLRRVETEYVLICDDDMVFGRRTDLRKMLRTLETTPFELVSCTCMDYRPGTSIREGIWCFEGTLDAADGVLVQRFGATRDTIDGLPVFDVVNNFFVARRETLGEDPWDARLKFGQEHTDFFLTMKERGVLCTRLPDVVVQHRPERLPAYEARRDREFPTEIWHEKWGVERKARVGRTRRRADRFIHRAPSAVLWCVRRAGRVGRRLLREGRLHAVPPRDVPGAG